MSSFVVPTKPDQLGFVKSKLGLVYSWVTENDLNLVIPAQFDQKTKTWITWIFHVYYEHTWQSYSVRTEMFYTGIDLREGPDQSNTLLMNIRGVKQSLKRPYLAIQWTQKYVLYSLAYCFKLYSDDFVTIQSTIA